MSAPSELRRRPQTGSHLPPGSSDVRKAPVDNRSCWSRIAQWLQNTSYQMLARTAIWDTIIRGFQPGRIRALELLDIQTEDSLLLVGAGSGADFECLPAQTNKIALRAFDFSPEMVQRSKVTARGLGIPEENCFVGDAQSLPFKEEKFSKICFPLSIASIPNPSLALQEAERVLSPKGKIVVFDKLVDDDQTISWKRAALNIMTRCAFADITRNLSGMLQTVPSLKIIHYESLEDKLEGWFTNQVSGSYRVAVLVRHDDYPDVPAISAIL
jgi:phosphatidylethanolamine/phosphatidyl-N-methylethanolamine N-methyltransferase